jgi:hypothetical protein
MLKKAAATIAMELALRAAEWLAQHAQVAVEHKLTELKEKRDAKANK